MPREMPRKDRNKRYRRKWKNTFLKEVALSTSFVEQRCKVETVWEDPTPLTKEELRIGYKAVRSKPRGKRPVRSNRHKREEWDEATYEHQHL